MNEYDMIYEELCERVECGELTLEEAELINDVAYDKYVSEGNAFNKLVNYHADEADKAESKARYYNNLSNDMKMSKRVRNAASGNELKYQGKRIANEFNKNLNAIPGNNSPVRQPSARELRRVYNDRSINDGDRETLRRYKQEWMKNHGNTGMAPEERYQAGRYVR